ncbi:MAG: response regulator [Lentisphaeria bacterium]|nr:response regulator [Lentisphaeria bacterium]
MDKNKLLKTNDAAHYLGVSRSSLTNWIKQGLISGGVTPGGHYRFTIAELDEFAVRRGLTRSGGAAPAVSAEEEPVKILVVDDDEAFREFVHDALEEFQGYELREAGDGLQGAMLIGSWRPDLLILDIRMPNMNGTELLKLIRQDEANSGMRVIIASAHLSPELKGELEALSADILLDKPVRLAKLVAAIQKMADLNLA